MICSEYYLGAKIIILKSLTWLICSPIGSLAQLSWCTVLLCFWSTDKLIMHDTVWPIFCCGVVCREFPVCTLAFGLPPSLLKLLFQTKAKVQQILAPVKKGLFTCGAGHRVTCIDQKGRHLVQFWDNEAFSIKMALI